VLALLLLFLVLLRWGHVDDLDDLVLFLGLLWCGRLLFCRRFFLLFLLLLFLLYLFFLFFRVFECVVFVIWECARQILVVFGGIFFDD
jgi:hypothetical protein